MSKFSKDWAFVVNTEKYQGLVRRTINDEGDERIAVSLIWDDLAVEMSLDHSEGAWAKIKENKAAPLFAALLKQLGL